MKKDVFPVYAGVILEYTNSAPFGGGVPRVCGGNPRQAIRPRWNRLCSPCMRGCYEVIIDKYMKKLMRHTV